MPVQGQTMRHPRTGERVTFGRTAADTDGQFCEFDLSVAPGGAPAAAHVHLHQVERFVIHAGTMRLRLGRAEREHGPGDSLAIPAGTPHTWSAAGGEELRVTVTIEPAGNADRFFEDFFGLAEAGKTMRSGVPTPLRLAVLLGDNAPFLYLERPPIPVQRALIAVLAPLGRTLGYGRR